jgi:hypothetical protein
MSNIQAEFVVGDFQFRVNPLKIENQMRGLAIVTSVLLPAIADVKDGLTPQGIASAIKGLDSLPELFALFAGVTKVNWQGNWVALATFKDDVFARRADLWLGYLAECIHVEYSSFLDERGKSVMTQAANLFSSLLA